MVGITQSFCVNVPLKAVLKHDYEVCELMKTSTVFGSTYINLVRNISLTLKSVSVNLRSVLPVSSNPDAISCSFKGGEKVVMEKLNIGRKAEGSPWERLGKTTTCEIFQNCIQKAYLHTASVTLGNK